MPEKNEVQQSIACSCRMHRSVVTSRQVRELLSVLTVGWRVTVTDTVLTDTHHRRHA